MSVNIKIEPLEFVPSIVDSSNVTKLRPQSESKLLRIGGIAWKEAPSGEYEARCTKVDVDWQFMGNRKLALYFTITEGHYAGYRARAFFAKREKELAEKTGADFGPRSNLYKLIKRISPKILCGDSITTFVDPNDLFFGKFFQITVELRNGKDNDSPKNAIVIDISHPDVGF